MAKKNANKEKMNEQMEIPSGVSVKMHHGVITIEKGNENVMRKINSVLGVNVEGNKLVISAKKQGRKEKRILGSFKAHIKNAFEGLNEKFKYKLQVATIHFPMTLTHDKNTNELVVKNFLGEKKDRRIKIENGVDLKINKDIIELESSDIEKAGQTAANIEKGTKIRHRDRRIFQDGIFITEKPGRIFL